MKRVSKADVASVSLLLQRLFSDFIVQGKSSVFFHLTPTGSTSNIPRSLKRKKFPKGRRAKIFGMFSVERQALFHFLKVCNPLLPNISMDILHSVLHTFSKVLRRRTCLTIRASFFVDHFLYSHDLNV